MIVDLRIRTDFAKTSRRQKHFDVLDQSSANSSPSELSFDPNAFEKRNRLTFTAIGEFSDGKFRESGGRAVGRFCDKAPRVVAAENIVDTLRESFSVVVGPQR